MHPPCHFPFPRTSFMMLLNACLCFQVSGRLTKPRIVGGEICSATDYPFAVAIFGISNCGGSLITLQWVLTAAHCLRPSTIEDDEVTIRSGYQAASNLIQIRYGVYAVVHKKFDLLEQENLEKPELRYDIGLLMADKPFKTGPTTKVIPLPKPGFTEKCTVATVMGTGIEHIIPYGRAETTKPLKCVDLNIVNKTTCKKSYETSVVDDTIVCTMELNSGKDACYGDSGGPLVCRKTLIGVVSYGRGCGNAGLAATYTKTESYLDWIKINMKYKKKPEPKPKSASSKNKKSPSDRKKNSLKLLLLAIYLFVTNLTRAL